MNHNKAQIRRALISEEGGVCKLEVVVISKSGKPKARKFRAKDDTSEEKTKSKAC